MLHFRIVFFSLAICTGSRNWLEDLCFEKSALFLPRRQV